MLSPNQRTTRQNGGSAANGSRVRTERRNPSRNPPTTGRPVSAGLASRPPTQPRVPAGTNASPRGRNLTSPTRQQAPPPSAGNGTVATPTKQKGPTTSASTRSPERNSGSGAGSLTQSPNLGPSSPDRVPALSVVSANSSTSAPDPIPRRKSGSVVTASGLSKPASTPVQPQNASAFLLTKLADDLKDIQSEMLLRTGESQWNTASPSPPFIHKEKEEARPPSAGEGPGSVPDNSSFASMGSGAPSPSMTGRATPAGARGPSPRTGEPQNLAAAAGLLQFDVAGAVKGLDSLDNDGVRLIAKELLQAVGRYIEGAAVAAVNYSPTLHPQPARMQAGTSITAQYRSALALATFSNRTSPEEQHIVLPPNTSFGASISLRMSPAPTPLKLGQVEDQSSTYTGTSAHGPLGARRAFQASQETSGFTHPSQSSMVTETSDVLSEESAINTAALLASRRRDSNLSLYSNQAKNPMKFTQELLRSETPDGTEIINQFLILDDICPGKVRLCYDQEEQEFRAMKILRRPSRIGKQTLQEIAIWKKLRHKNIVTLYEVIDDPGSKILFIIMQFVDKGPLVDSTSGGLGDGITCDTIDPFKLLFYARQIVAGLAYLHIHGIVHNDIKPANILLGKDDQVYLADFGVSEIQYDEMEQPEDLNEDTPTRSGGARPISRRGIGTPAFFAPEVVTLRDKKEKKDSPPKNTSPPMSSADHGEPYRSDSPMMALHQHNYFEVGKAGDIWALGVTFYMMLTGYLPFCPRKHHYPDSVVGADMSMSASTISSPLNYWTKYQRALVAADVEYPKCIPTPWRTLLGMMLEKDPSKRVDVHYVRHAIRTMKLVGGENNQGGFMLGLLERGGGGDRGLSPVPQMPHTPLLGGGGAPTPQAPHSPLFMPSPGQGYINSSFAPALTGSGSDKQSPPPSTAVTRKPSPAAAGQLSGVPFPPPTAGHGAETVPYDIISDDEEELMVAVANVNEGRLKNDREEEEEDDRNRAQVQLQFPAEAQKSAPQQPFHLSPRHNHDRDEDSHSLSPSVASTLAPEVSPSSAQSRLSHVMDGHPRTPRASDNRVPSARPAPLSTLELSRSSEFDDNGRRGTLIPGTGPCRGPSPAHSESLENGSPTTHQPWMPQHKQQPPQGGTVVTASAPPPHGTSPYQDPQRAPVLPMPELIGIGDSDLESPIARRNADVSFDSPLVAPGAGSGSFGTPQPSKIAQRNLSSRGRHVVASPGDTSRSPVPLQTTARGSELDTAVAMVSGQQRRTSGGRVTPGAPMRATMSPALTRSANKRATQPTGNFAGSGSNGGPLSSMPNERRQRPVLVPVYSEDVELAVTSVKRQQVIPPQIPTPASSYHDSANMSRTSAPQSLTAYPIGVGVTSGGVSRRKVGHDHVLGVDGTTKNPLLAPHSGPGQPVPELRRTNSHGSVSSMCNYSFTSTGVVPSANTASSSGGGSTAGDKGGASADHPFSVPKAERAEGETTATVLDFEYGARRRAKQSKGRL